MTYKPGSLSALADSMEYKPGRLSALSRDLGVEDETDIAARNLEERGDINRGLRAGWSNLKGMSGGALGLLSDTLGDEKAAERFARYYEDKQDEAALNPPRIGSFHEIRSVGDALDWLQYGGASQVPILASIAASGGVGGSAGVVLGTGAIEGGGMWGDQVQRAGLENTSPLQDIRFGMLSGATELAGPIGRIAAKLPVSPGRIAKKVVVGFVEEGLQEGIQGELADINEKLQNPETDIITKKRLVERVNEMLLGGIFGGIGGTIEGVRAPEIKPKATPEDIGKAETIDDAIGKYQEATDTVEPQPIAKPVTEPTAEPTAEQNIESTIDDYLVTGEEADLSFEPITGAMEANALSTAQKANQQGKVDRNQTAFLNEAERQAYNTYQPELPNEQKKTIENSNETLPEPENVQEGNLPTREQNEEAISNSGNLSDLTASDQQALNDYKAYKAETSTLSALGEKKEKPVEKNAAENKESTGIRVRLDGQGPQVFEVVRKEPATKADLPGESFYTVRNVKTGEEHVIDNETIIPIKGNEKKFNELGGKIEQAQETQQAGSEKAAAEEAGTKTEAEPTPRERGISRQPNGDIRDENDITKKKTAYELASENLAKIEPTIIDGSNVNNKAYKVFINIRDLGGKNKSVKLAAPYDGSEKDALRVAKALRFKASDEYGASMSQSETFGTNGKGEPTLAFTQGQGKTVINKIAPRDKKPSKVSASGEVASASQEGGFKENNGQIQNNQENNKTELDDGSKNKKTTLPTYKKIAIEEYDTGDNAGLISNEQTPTDAINGRKPSKTRKPKANNTTDASTGAPSGVTKTSAKQTETAHRQGKSGVKEEVKADRGDGKNNHEFIVEDVTNRNGDVSKKELLKKIDEAISSAPEPEPKDGFTGSERLIFPKKQRTKNGRKIIDELPGDYRLVRGKHAKEWRLEHLDRKKNGAVVWTKIEEIGDDYSLRNLKKKVESFLLGHMKADGQVIFRNPRKSYSFTVDNSRYALEKFKERVKRARGSMGVKFSKTENTGGSTTAQIRAELSQKLGTARTNRLLRTGKVKIIASNEIGGILSGDQIKFMTAWHGSPHDFDNFTTDAIGSGEGAQAYGYGLYFTEKKDIAEFYKRSLASDISHSMSQIATAIKSGDKANNDTSANILLQLTESYSSLDNSQIKQAKLEPEDFGFYDVEDTIPSNRLRSHNFGASDIVKLNVNGTPYTAYIYNDRSAIIDDGEKLKAIRIPRNRGRLYKVELAPKEDEYLLWDKPLSEQSEKVRGAIHSSIETETKIKKKKEWEQEQPDLSFIGDAIESLDDGYSSYVNRLRYKKKDLVSIAKNGTGGDFHRAMEWHLSSKKKVADVLKSNGIRGIKYLDGTSRSKGDGNYNYVIFSDKDVSITEKFSKNGNIEGFAKDGTAYLVHDNIKKGQSYRVLLHELGSHLYLEGKFTGKKWDGIISTLRRHAKKNTATGKAVRAAREMVPKKTSPEHYDSEVLAYYIANQANIKQSLYRRVIAFVKDALVSLGFSAKIFSPEDLAVIAENGLMGGTMSDKVMEGIKASMDIFKPVDVNSKAFRRWLRGSKVVDENGKPLVVYHGTLLKNVFNIFKTVTSRESLGAHFGTKEAAIDRMIDYKDSEVKIIPVYLSAKNPLRLDDLVYWTPEDVAGVINKMISSGKIDIKKIEKRKGFQGSSYFDNKDIVRSLKDGGYDSIVYKNMYEDNGNDSYIVFSPTQIKSAATNTGEFSPTNQDIRYSITNDLDEEQKSFLSKIGAQPETKSKVAKFKEIAGSKNAVVRSLAKAHNYLRQGIVDQFHSIHEILGDKRSWMLMHLTKSDTGVLMAAIKDGIPVLHHSGAVTIKKGSKGMEQVLKPLGKDVDRFLAWIAAQRAERLLAEGRENNFTPGEIEAGKRLNEGKLEDGRDRKDVYKSVYEEYEKLNSGIVEFAVDTGLINEEEAARWRDDGAYIPFYRMIDESDNTHGPSNISSIVNQKGVRRLKGSDKNIDDLLTNVLLNWNHLISAGLRNQAGFEALNSAVEQEYAHQIPKKLKGKNSVFVRENGKELWFNVDDNTPEGRLVLEALTSLNYEGLTGKAMDIMRGFKHALTTGVTVSPGFKVRNLIRDTLTAPAISTASKNPFKNIMVGFDKETMKLMEAGGGAFSQEGYVHGADDTAIKDLVGVKRGDILDTRSRLKRMFRYYEDFGNKLENINRVASFKNDLESGKTLLEANFNARDQLDFSRTGAFKSVRFISQSVPFINARLQGLDKMARALGDKQQRKQFIQVVGTYTVASVILMLMMMDDKDYDEAPEWEKRTYHLFKVPGSEKMFRIPRPFEVGSIGYLTEKLYKLAIGQQDGQNELKDAFIHTLSDTFAMNPIPQVAKPLVELYANKSFFTGRSIESMGMKYHSKKYRARPWTSETAKKISAAESKVLPEPAVLSPVQIEHLARAYGGWLGTQTLGFIDFMLKTVEGKKDPERYLDEYKFNPIESFSREAPAKSSKYIGRFYDNLQQLSKEWNDIKKYRNASPEEVKRLRFRKRYNLVARRLSKIRKEEARVYSSNLTPHEKRVRLDRLRKHKNELAKSMVKLTDGLF